jgi:CubicO group peptidase (beta-lactamase class C family)
VDSAVALGRDEIFDLLEREPLPAVSVAVMHHSELVWAAAFGDADRAYRVRAAPWTRFRVASVSKPLTSAALGRLLEQGQLDLDAPVRELVPEYPDQGHPITSRQLAAHLSGIPHYEERDLVNRVHYRDVIHALDKFKDRPLLSAPGERYSYSSFGWNLLAAVIQRTAGTDFLEYMQREVFEPAGMTHTEADRSEVWIPQRTCFYAIEPDGTVVDAPAVDNSDLWAAGGFLSTAEDLVRFGDAMLAGSLLEPATVDVLWEIQKTASEEATGYGLGWRWSPLEGHRQVGHDGSHVGSTSRLMILPDDDLVLAILTNANSRLLSATLERIALRILD